MITHTKRTVLAIVFLTLFIVVPVSAASGTSDPIHSTGKIVYQPNPPNGNSSLASGVNYMSAGNTWSSDSNSQLSSDFSRFAGDGIKHVSARIMWSVMEPTYYADSCHLSSTALNNYRRLLNMAGNKSIRVNVDFWTQFTYTLGKPSWVNSYYDIVTNTATRANYIRYQQAVVTALKDYPAIESWAVLNEPFWQSTNYKTQFQTYFKLAYDAIKAIDPVHYVTCRFTLSYTPGSGKYDTSVYDIFDVFAITEYLDPSNPSDTRYNGKWSYWDKTVSDCKARNKPLWVIEFGDNNANLEHVRLHYELSLKKFEAAGVEIVFAWAWQTRSASAESFNIYDGSAPEPAYYELAKYPE